MGAVAFATAAVVTVPASAVQQAQSADERCFDTPAGSVTDGSNQAVSDAAADHADILELCVTFTSDELVLTVEVADPTDPASDPNWTQAGETMLAFDLATEATQEFPDDGVVLGETAYAVEVIPQPTGGWRALLGDPDYRCDGTPELLSDGYRVTFDVSDATACLDDDVSRLAVRPLMIYDTAPRNDDPASLRIDAHPGQDGHHGWIERQADEGEVPADGPDADPWPAHVAGESAWPVMHADAQGTRRARTSGPSDPGLKWHTDLAEVQTSFAPEGYNVAGGLSRARGPAVVGPDGTLVRPAVNNDPQYDRGRFGRELIGIDPDDGSVKWEIPHASTEHSRCLPAVDSQGRVWTDHYKWEDRSDDGKTLLALDPSDGSTQTSFHLEPNADGDLPSFCRRTALHVGGDGTNERLVLFGGWGDPSQVLALDISGANPSVAWQGVPGASPEDDEVVGVPGTTDRRQIAVFTDDAMFLALRTDVDTSEEAVSILRLSLADGSLTGSIELPVPDGQASADYDRPDMLIAYDDTLVFGSRGGQPGYLAAIDISGPQLQEAWVRELISNASPSPIALGAGVVMTQPAGTGGFAGQTRAVWGFRISDGAPVWDGVAMHTAFITDATGSGYTTFRGSGEARARILGSFHPDGRERWRIERSSVAEAAGVGSFDDLNVGNFGPNTKIGPIDADGTLYIGHESSTGMLALDDSGGLREPLPMPFPDVDPDNPHADNIAELYHRGITRGDADGNYNPRGTVTRAQFATFLANAFGLDPVQGDHFTDVPPDNAHAGNIYAVAEAGFTQGTSPTTFDPNGTLPREQMASLLARAFGLDPVQGDHFTDVRPDSTHAGNIYAVAEAGITVGTTPTTFDPGGTLFRDQMASLLIRGLDSQAG